MSYIEKFLSSNKKSYYSPSLNKLLNNDNLFTPNHNYSYEEKSFNFSPNLNNFATRALFNSNKKINLEEELSFPNLDLFCNQYDYANNEINLEDIQTENIAQKTPQKAFIGKKILISSKKEEYEKSDKKSKEEPKEKSNEKSNIKAKNKGIKAAINNNNNIISKLENINIINDVPKACNNINLNVNIPIKNTYIIKSLNSSVDNDFFSIKAKEKISNLFCNCYNSCLNGKCKCFKNAKACSVLCGCPNCKNNYKFTNIRTYKLLNYFSKNIKALKKFNRKPSKKEYFKDLCPNCGWRMCRCI